MSIWDICNKRPIFTAMLVSAPLVLGLASYRGLGVDLFQNVDLPAVTVTTTLRGASVDEMEAGVTKSIEEIVNTISGIDELPSTTKEGPSQMVVQFVLENNGAVAAQELRDKNSTILSQLPENIANRRGHPIRSEYIGRVEDSYKEPRGVSRFWVKELAQCGRVKH